MASEIARGPAGHVPSWHGCYIGAHMGYAGGRSETLDLPFTQGPSAGLGFAWNTPAGETIDADGEGLTGGGQAGCDLEFPVGGTTLVVGAVGDGSGLDLSASGTSALSSDTHTTFDAEWTATLRARLGFASPDLLLYATGGVAFADIGVRAFDRSSDPSPGLMDVSGSSTETGWVVGAGIEWRVTSPVSLSLEYLHMEFDGVVATGAATNPATAHPRFETDLEIDTVRLGVNWRM